MFRGLLFATIGFFLVLLKDQVAAQGANVIVFLNEGQQVGGELLAVRDTALLIDTLGGTGEATSVTQFAGLVRVGREAIQKVKVKGESFRLKGTLIGAAIGGTVGAVIGFASGDDPPGTMMRYTAGQKALLGGAVLGVIGVLVGGMSGVAWSSKDKEYDASMDESWVSLKAVARYQDKEPEFLQVIK